MRSCSSRRSSLGAGGPDISDEAYRAARAETLEQLSLLPDSDKLVAFDQNRKVMTSMAANVGAATLQQQAELAQMLVERVVAADGKVAEGASSGRRRLGRSLPSVV